MDETTEQLRAGRHGVPGPIRLTPVIFTKFLDFVVVAKVATVAIFPNLATAGIEERVVPPAIRELDSGEVSLRHGGLGLKDRFQCDHGKKQCDEREDRLGVKVNTHVSISKFSAGCGTSQIGHF
jgi:hypothetical protein